MNKILGLDLGISSVGWAIIDNEKIIDGGVRIFTKAENPKTRESLALPRRDARSQRRTIKRKRQRLNKIRKLLIDSKILNNEDEFFNLFNKVKINDVWKLRVEALNRKLDRLEFARVLYHIAKHRGFKFGSKSEEKESNDNETKKVLNSISINKNQIKDKKYLTYAEYIVSEFDKYKNTNEDYSHSISRDMLKNEIDIVFFKQIEFKNEFATEELKNEYWQIADYTKEPQSIEKMVGKCTILIEEKRASKASYSAELFIAVGKILNTTLVNGLKYEKLIDYISIDEILELAHKQKKLTYKSIRKLAKLDKNITFKGFDDENKTFIELKAYHILITIISDKSKFNEIAKVLAYYKSDEQKREELKEIVHDDKIIEELLTISFSGFINYSLKVINDILPLMLKGIERDKALLHYGYSEKRDYEKGLLPALNKIDIDIANPVVIRAISELRKVVNAIVRKYGTFDRVHIELTRDINSKKDREQIRKSQGKDLKNKKEAEKFILENFNIKESDIKAKDILKVRLYLEQQNRCIYSNEPIIINKLFENGYLEIDHILPYSRSLDDSISNKVLVLTDKNQNKSNRTPFEWFGDDEFKWEEFKNLIESNPNFKKNRAKKKKLLKENFNDENSQKAFIDRNLNDTRYLSKAILDYVKNHLKLNPPKKKDELQVQVRNGRLISNLRHQWGLNTKNRENHLHHLEDAIIVAFATQSMVQKFANYIRNREYKKRVKFTTPCENFRNDVFEFLDKFKNSEKFVSRPPRKKVTGKAHSELPYSLNMGRNIKRERSKKEVKSGVEVNGGICENGEIIRIDIFEKESKYYVVAIHISDFLKNNLPNITINGLKVDDSFKFKYSIFKDDLIEVKTKDNKVIRGYFLQLSKTSFLINSHNNIKNEIFHREKNSKAICEKGVTNLQSIKKFQISPIGDISEVKSERRI